MANNYFYSKQFYGVIFQQSSVRAGLKYPGPSEMIYGASIGLVSLARYSGAVVRDKEKTRVFVIPYHLICTNLYYTKIV